jgi:thiamine-phosphate diphosphorylase
VTFQPALELRQALHLVFIVDGHSARDGDLVDTALGSGVSALWLRVPGATGAELYRLAHDLRLRTRAHGRALLVGDRADVALAADADGVQLGHRSPPTRHVRPWFDRWIGVSCHSAGDLERAGQDAADYAVLSPLFGVPEKGTPLGLAAFKRLREDAPLPVVALGGIDETNVGEVRRLSPAGVAVIRALRDAAEPARTARRLSEPMTTP